MKNKQTKTTRSCSRTCTNSTDTVLEGYLIRPMNTNHQKEFGFTPRGSRKQSNPQLARALAALRPGEYILGTSEQDRVDALSYNRTLGYDLRTRAVRRQDSRNSYIIARVA